MRRCALILFGLIGSTGAMAQDLPRAMPDDAFEAALRTATVPQQPAAGSGGGWVRNSPYQAAPAPAGTVPVRWRDLTRYPTDDAALEADVDAGLLDPAALMQQIVGPLPIPPGAMPAGCRRSARFLLFTMGEELSAAYREMIAVRSTADPGDLRDRASIDARETRERISRFLLDAGFRQIAARDMRGFADEQRRVRVDLYDSSAIEQYACGYDADSLRLPTGPLLMISHFVELGAGEAWKDGGVSRPAD